MLAHLSTLRLHIIKSRYKWAKRCTAILQSTVRDLFPRSHWFDTLQGDDSTAQKITGSIVNAVIFVAVIALMTFVLVLLFKYGVR